MANFTIDWAENATKIFGYCGTIVGDGVCYNRYLKGEGCERPQKPDETTRIYCVGCGKLLAFGEIVEAA